MFSNMYIFKRIFINSADARNGIANLLSTKLTLENIPTQIRLLKNAIKHLINV